MYQPDMLFLQREFCKKKGLDCVLTKEEDIVGFAVNTHGEIPINGLRHPSDDTTSGWYIWCGEEYSSDPDFFAPLHAQHLYERAPDILKLLGLPPGYRFLLAGDYIDVWFDQSLLDV